MPETPVKFVDGVGTGIETVDMEVSARDAILAGITTMLKALFLGTPG